MEAILQMNQAQRILTAFKSSGQIEILAKDPDIQDNINYIDIISSNHLSASRFGSRERKYSYIGEEPNADVAIT